MGMFRGFAAVIKERTVASAIDLAFGGRLCRTDLNEAVYNGDRHTMVHSDYHVLRDIFARVPIAKDDVLVASAAAKDA